MGAGHLQKEKTQDDNAISSFCYLGFLIVRLVLLARRKRKDMGMVMGIPTIVFGIVVFEGIRREEVQT